MKLDSVSTIFFQEYTADERLPDICNCKLRVYNVARATAWMKFFTIEAVVIVHTEWDLGHKARLH